MVKPGIGEVVFIAVRSQVFIHERNGGRLIIKGADVHDLHALTFVNGQKFCGTAIQLFLPGLPSQTPFWSQTPADE